MNRFSPLCSYRYVSVKIPFLSLPPAVSKKAIKPNVMVSRCKGEIEDLPPSRSFHSRLHCEYNWTSLSGFSVIDVKKTTTTSGRKTGSSATSWYAKNIFYGNSQHPNHLVTFLIRTDDEPSDEESVPPSSKN